MAGKKERRSNKGWVIPLEVTADGKIQRARAPTRDELLDLFVDLHDHVKQLPPELFLRLRRQLHWHLRQQRWSRELILRMRWSFVCEGLDRGKPRVGADGAYEYAVNALMGSPAEAGDETMRKAYDEMQSKLPYAQRWRRKAR